MSWQEPETQATGDLITAAIWNTDLVENLKAVAQPYARSSSDVTVDNTTAETTLATFSVTGGDMGTNGIVELLLWGRYLQNVSATGTFRLKYGATTVVAHPGVFPTNSASVLRYEAYIRLALGATASAQEGASAVVTTADGTMMAVGTGAENSGSTLTLAVTFQWSAASASASLVNEFYRANLDVSA